MPKSVLSANIRLFKELSIEINTFSIYSKEIEN